MKEIKKEYEAMMYYLEKKDNESAIRHMNKLIFLVLTQTTIKEL